MVDTFPFDTSFLVLLVMGCLSMVLSLSFYSKFRILGRISRKLSISVFDKTFNVFDPYPGRRKIIHRFIVLMPFLLMVGYFFLMFLILKTFEMGLVLGVTIFIICLGLMMVDEAYEIYVNSNVFVKAARNKANFFEGDFA